jgi:hypothetical protein
MLGVAPYDEEIVEEVAAVFRGRAVAPAQRAGAEASAIRGLARHARNAGMAGEDVVEVVEQQRADRDQRTTE